MRLTAQIRRLSRDIDLKKNQNHQCYTELKHKMASTKVLLIALAGGFLASNIFPKLISRKPYAKIKFQKLKDLLSKKPSKKVSFLFLGMTALKYFLNIHPIGRHLGPLRRLLA